MKKKKFHIKNFSNEDKKNRKWMKMKVIWNAVEEAIDGGILNNEEKGRSFEKMRQ